MGWRFAVEIIAVLIMFGAVGGLYYGVIKGIIALNVRAIQFLAISFGQGSIRFDAAGRKPGDPIRGAWAAMVAPQPLPK